MTTSRRITKIASQPQWLDRAGDRLTHVLNNIVAKSPRTRRAAEWLHGAWLGHPLHPPLTDLPIGAWSVAGVFDAISLAGARQPRRYAGYAIAIGVLGALPTAAAGAMDWRHTSGETRRAGVSHALLNGGALACYSLSLLCRIAGRGPARPLGFVGLCLACAGAYLGGELVSVSRVGVRYDAQATAPTEPVDVIDVAALQEGVLHRVEAGGYPMALLKTGSTVRAYSDVCPHMGCSLSKGTLQDWSITCPCHGSSFDVLDGAVTGGPSAFPLTVFPTEIRDGRVYVLPDQAD